MTGAPVAGAQVFVLGTQRPAVTDGTGQFRHTGLAAAFYLLQVRKTGYVAMTWEVMAVDDTAVVHLLELHPLQLADGKTALTSGRPGSAVVRGGVIERATETPILGAEVLVLGRPAPETTDGAGYFRHAELAPTSHVVKVRKIGYEPITAQVAAADDSTFVHVLELSRLDVPVMDRLVVEGTPVESPSYWHPDFERRRTEGRGQFLTRREILQRNAATLGDLLRTLNGLRMTCTSRGNDPPGEAHALDVAQALYSRASIKIVHLDGLPEKGRLTPLSRPQNWKNKVDSPALNIGSQWA